MTSPEELKRSSLWLNAIDTGHQVYQQVLTICEGRGKMVTTDVLSPDVRDCLRITCCAIPQDVFCFSIHPSSIRGKDGRAQTLLRQALLHECQQLSVRVEMAVSGCDAASAQIKLECATTVNHKAVQDYCDEKRIQIARKSRLYNRGASLARFNFCVT